MMIFSEFSSHLLHLERMGRYTFFIIKKNTETLQELKERTILIMFLITIQIKLWLSKYFTSESHVTSIVAIELQWINISAF